MTCQRERDLHARKSRTHHDHIPAKQERRLHERVLDDDTIYVHCDYLPHIICVYQPSKAIVTSESSSCSSEGGRSVGSRLDMFEGVKADVSIDARVAVSRYIVGLRELLKNHCQRRTRADGSANRTMICPGCIRQSIEMYSGDRQHNANTINDSEVTSAIEPLQKSKAPTQASTTRQMRARVPTSTARDREAICQSGRNDYSAGYRQRRRSMCRSCSRGDRRYDLIATGALWREDTGPTVGSV